MGELNWVAIVAGASAFFGTGLIWYGLLFGRQWRKSAELPVDQAHRGSSPAVLVLTFIAELVVALTLWHALERSGASDRATMMMAVGFGATIMAPALGINYLYLRKSLALFVIDAGHLVVGMAAMGGVFLLFR